MLTNDIVSFEQLDPDFFYFTTKTYVVGTGLKCLTEVLLITVLSTSLRKSFVACALHRKSKFSNFCHDLTQNHLSSLPIH